MEPSLSSITELQTALRRGDLTCLELAESCLRQVERRDGELRAFITVLGEALLAQAREMDGKPPKDRPPLYGLPLGLKDLFATRGIRTTAGSKFFADHVPDEDAFVVQRLEQAGALFVGKNNLHEIALGVTNINPHYGTSRNPSNPAHMTGGSSGGSAVGVTTGMCVAALGTDTGGSIRIPSALCGTVGLKPTTGRVSLRGVFPLSWNLDHAGPIARTVRDAAVVYAAIAGHDPLDPASAEVPFEDPLPGLEDGVRGWRIALAAGEYFEASDPAVLAVVREAAKAFTGLGARVEEVDLSWLGAAAAANGRMTQSDGAAFHRERLQSRPQDFGPDVLQRLQAGAALTSSDYVLARRTQVEMRHRLANFFREYDLLLTPTTPVTAPLIDGADSVAQAARLTRFTAPFNLTGVPALSVPCGLVDGLPVGLQIVAGHWQEAKALRAGQACETVLGK